MTNAELLAQAGGVLHGMGVSKADTVMTTANMGVGDFMDRTQVERLVDLTVSQSGWLSAVSLKMRNQRAGEIPRISVNGVVTEGVAENGGNTVATVPETDNVEYNCKKYQATWFITIEDIREARASGEPEFERKIRRLFAKAMGNDMARWTLRGDRSLDTSTRLNRLLRQRDGWLKQIRASGIVATTGRGAPYSRNLFTSMQSAMPEEYRDDADLRWLIPSLLDLAHTDELATAGDQGSELSSRAKIERRRFTPQGIPQLIIPQMPTSQGFSVVTASTAAADGIVDNAGANLTVTVDTLFGGYNAQWDGRKVKITLNTSGETEIRTVVDSGSTLTFTTAGNLGQSTISTTPGDYTLDLADVTTAILTNPSNLFLVMCDRIRAYRKFEQEYERWRVDVFYEADCGVFNENAVVLQDGIATPSFDFGAGF